MAYRCKNCGKFVARDATFCKHCGQENPAEMADSSTSNSTPEGRSTNVNQPKKIPATTRWIDGTTMGYPNRTWRNVAIFLVAVFVFYFFATKDNKQSQSTAQQFQNETRVQTPIEEVEDESRELVVVDGEALVREALPKSDYQIVNRWREINQGSTSQECRLERINRDGSYRIKIGGIYFSCEPRKITNGSGIIFHNANSHNGEFFNLANGTPIYFIPQMQDDGSVKTDGILVIQADGSAQVYMNDYRNEFFELFTDLRPLY